MPLPLAHGGWIELIVWLAWLLVLLAAWLVVVAAASLLLALLYGPLLMMVVRRGRHLMWLMPIVNAVLVVAIDPAPAAAGLINQPFLGVGLLRTSGWVIAGICGLIAASFVAGAGRIVRRRDVTVAADVPMSRPSPAPVIALSTPNAPATPAPAAPVVPAVAPAPVVAPVTPSSSPGGLREGLQAPVEGFRYLAAHPALWRYAALPILLNVLITGLVLLVLIGTGVWFAVQLHPRFSPTWWGAALEVLAAAGILVCALALAAVTWLVLNGILCGHFYAKLARQVELQLGTPAEAMRDVPLRYQVVDTFRDLFALVAINGGLLLLNVIPLVGSLAALVLGVYFDGFIFGADYLDFPMSLRGMRRREKRDLARAHRWQTVGLGAAVFAFNLVPIIGSVLGAGAAVGAVLLFHRWPEAQTARQQL